MTPRSIRRAAERKARKEMDRKARAEMDRKARAEQDRQPPTDQDHHARGAALNLSELTPASDRPVAPETTPRLPVKRSPISSGRLAANRANARLSTGPKRDESKAKTSLNAVKTALTGRTVLLASDDAQAYEKHVLAYSEELRPLTQRESDLVQSIADTAWRLKRIPALEMAIYAMGRIEFAENFNHHDPSARPSLIEVETYFTYEKQLRNLQLQEARLHRRYQKDTAELRQIQAEREERQPTNLEAAANLLTAAQNDHQPFGAEANGFEFSLGEIGDYVARIGDARTTRATLQEGKTQPQAA